MNHHPYDEERRILEQRYRALISGQDDIVSRYEPEGLRITFVSPAYCELFGRNEAELLGVSILDLLETDQSRNATSERLKLINSENPTIRGQNTVVIGSGDRRQVLWSTTGIFDGKGALVEYQSIGRDVTTLQQAEQELSKSRTHYVQAAKIADIGFWVWDEIEDRLVFCTEEAASIYGVTVDEAMARSYSLEANARTTHPEDLERYMKVMEDAQRARKGYDVTIRTLRSDGETRFIRHLGEPIFDAEGTLIQTVGTVQDVTDEQKTHEKLIAARLAADSANRSKSEFLASVSHELRTPLNAIIGFSELLTMEPKGPLGSPAYMDYAESIRKSGGHLLSLINDILDLSKIEAGKTENAPEDIPLAASIAESLELVRIRFNDDRSRLAIKLSFDTPTVYADPRHFRQIIVNMLSNADKFTPEGGKITIASEPMPDGGVRVIVSDTGVGIPEDDIERVLEPFGQADLNVQLTQEGTGLGLPLSRKLMELHGGSLELESRVGEGTTVTLTFPPGLRT